MKTDAHKSMCQNVTFAPMSGVVASVISSELKVYYLTGENMQEPGYSHGRHKLSHHTGVYSICGRAWGG